MQKPKRNISTWRFTPPPGTSAKMVSLDGDDVAVLVVPVHDPKPNPGALSEAEREVANLVLDGKTNEEIADARRTSVRTVANQLQSIYRKLGIGSRVELVTFLVDERAGVPRPRASVSRQRGTSSRSKQGPK